MTFRTYVPKLLQFGIFGNFQILGHFRILGHSGSTGFFIAYSNLKLSIHKISPYISLRLQNQ